MAPRSQRSKNPCAGPASRTATTSSGGRDHAGATSQPRLIATLPEVPRGAKYPFWPPAATRKCAGHGLGRVFGTHRLRPERREQRTRHRPMLQRPEHPDIELRTPAQQEEHPIPSRDPQPVEHIREPTRQARERRVAVLAHSAMSPQEPQRQQDWAPRHPASGRPSPQDPRRRS